LALLHASAGLVLADMTSSFITTLLFPGLEIASEQESYSGGAPPLASNRNGSG
jgi:hypothetical protein